jgi:hypothetical protein
MGAMAKGLRVEVDRVAMATSSGWKEPRWSEMQ